MVATYDCPCGYSRDDFPKVPFWKVTSSFFNQWLTGPDTTLLHRRFSQVWELETCPEKCQIGGEATTPKMFPTLLVGDRDPGGQGLWARDLIERVTGLIDGSVRLY